VTSRRSQVAKSAWQPDPLTVGGWGSTVSEVHDYRQLAVWKRAHALVLAVYSATRHFPRSEELGLSSQMRRAAASVPTNLAEGAGSSTDRAFGRFIGYSVASSLELEYQIMLARDLAYLEPKAAASLHRELGEIRGMLLALGRSLKQR